MSWRLEGRYFENCPCDAPCPCTVSLDLPADTDRCTPVLVFHIDSGEIEGVNVDGLTVVAAADAPKLMLEGNWRIGVFIDGSASDEQAARLGAVFSGQLGGPMSALGALVGENLGAKRVPIEFSSDGGVHSVRVGDSIDIEVEDIVPVNAENGEAVRWSNLAHPAGSELTVAKSKKSQIDAFDIKFENAPGSSAFSTKFSWAA